LLDNLQAIREETDVRILELKKDALEFKREIVLGAVNPRTGKVMAERVERYMREKIREKVCFKNAIIIIIIIIIIVIIIIIIIMMMIIIIYLVRMLWWII